MSGAPEGFIIDPDGSSPLNLGNSGSLRLAALTVPPAPKRLEWASNADTDGQALVRNPLHDNRSCTMQVRVSATSMDAAMTALGTLQGKLQEACIQGAGNGPGLKCNWTPSGASHTLALYMVYGEITDLPVTYDDGWFANQPVVTVAFQCKPFLYGAEVTGPTASGTNPLLTVEVDSVPGDVPAEARLVVTDGTAQPRRWVEWGLEQEYYNATSPAPLFVDSGSLVTSGFAGAGSALTGAFGGSVVGANLFAQPLAVCGTGNLSHVGSFRVKTRVWAASTNEFWRLSWKSGDSDLTSNAYAQPVAGGAFNELDFGIVTIPPVAAGTQIWSGRVEAYTTTTGGEAGAVDYVDLLPADEGYGRMEAAYSYQPGVTAGLDEFTGLANGTALNARVAPLGGTWTAASIFKGDGDNQLVTTTGSSGFALLGGTVTGAIETGVDFDMTAETGATFGVVCRYNSSTSWLRLRYTGLQIILDQDVSGTTTNLALTLTDTELAGALRLVAYPSGHAIASLLDSTGALVAQLEAISSTLATGGSLANGQAGLFADGGVSLVTLDNFYRATPSAEPLVINSGKSIQVTSDSNLRQSADGASYGDLPSRGSRLFIPQAGDAGRSTRIAVRATREDPITMASRNDGDSTQLAVFYRPRYLAVPRS